MICSQISTFEAVFNNFYTCIEFLHSFFLHYSNLGIYFDTNYMDLFNIFIQIQ